MKEDIKKELNDLSPFLSELEKDDPFKTPKFYFDTLADKVLEKAKGELQAPPQLEKQFSLTERINAWFSSIWQPRYAVAFASLAILFVAGWFFIKQQDKAFYSTTDITKEEIHKYITENINDFDEDLIIQTGTIAAETEGGNLEHQDVNIEDIENYLKENLNEKDLDSLSNEL